MESLLDPWESINCLDDAHRQEGIDAGYKDGLISGKEAGKQLGIDLGFGVGVELGYYQACLDVLNAAMKIEPDCFSSRVQENVRQMDELINTYPVFDPENESVQDIMEVLRSKYKLIEANTPMKNLSKERKEEIYIFEF
ncbi:hypothetical protein MKW94_029810 [Papaver nudicaule]|uniref:Uncharacterized protein n=1 Tax=Papaver nudicaule TaxID=74823 RepID=A0AA41V1Q2_PAPNU|nr:hypothetical protein [Papaver nudicaule]